MTIHPKIMFLLQAHEEHSSRMELAEEVIRKWNNLYPRTTIVWAQAGTQAAKSAHLLQAFHQFHNELCQSISKRDYALPYPKRENLRHSSKTGKSWPKPKGSY